MRPVFLDTVGLLAVWDEDDQWHAAASGVYARLLTARRVFVTTRTCSRSVRTRLRTPASAPPRNELASRECACPNPAVWARVEKVENHEHMVALHYMYYNFARIHQTLRVRPAMEAGGSDHVWSLGRSFRY